MDKELQAAVVTVVEELRPTAYIPNPATRGKTSTGNLAFQALKDNRVYENSMVVYIDQRQAPYTPYTNEPWLSRSWRGKKNPNEGWWDRFAQEFAKRLADELGGELQ